MIFESHHIKPPLDFDIESIFYFKNFTPEHAIERVVPTGHIFLIFELDDITRNTFDNETLKANAEYKNVWVSGVHSNYLSISAHHNSEMFVVQFKPLGCYPFFKFSGSDIFNKVVPAEQLFGNNILNLRAEIKQESTPNKKFEIIESWLKNLYSKSNRAPDELHSFVNSLIKEPITNHQSIVSNYPKSQKHLITQLKKYCGLTPNILHRIYRFNAILGRIQNKEKIRWAQIAHEFDYTDQSHFIKEFKKFSGFNPEEFIKNDYHEGEPNFFPIDKKG